MKLVTVVKNYLPEILSEIISSLIFKITIAISFGVILEDNFAGIIAQFILNKTTENYLDKFMTRLSHK